MDIYLLDENFEIISIIDDFSSLIWRRKYYECGDFELHCSHELFRTIASEAKYVYRSDRKEVGIIENYGLTHPTAFCKGRFLEKLLYDKVIYPTAAFSGKTHEEIAISLIDSLTPEISILPSAGGNIGSKITTQVSGDNLMEYLYELLKTVEASFTVSCDLHAKSVFFYVFKGDDKRASAVFSEEWDNLISMTYEYSEKDYKNYAIVAGQEKGPDRQIVKIDQTNGARRRELFVDARDLQQNEGESLDDYKARLTQRGIEKLAEYAMVEKCDAAIDTESNLEYIADFNLGDICTITKTEHGISCEKRITECEEVYENGTFSLSVIFGEGYLILPKYLERKLK